jgi:transglutaminase-like putative cysteine protease
MNKPWQWLVLISLFNFPAYGQSKINFTELQQKYPNDDLVLLREEEKITIRTDQNRLRIEAEHQEEFLFMNEQANRYADHHIRYSDFFQAIGDLEAFTYVPLGNRYQKVAVKEIKTEKPSSQGIFYDDTFVKRFNFEGVKKGAIGTVSYKETIKDAHTLSGFMFGRYIPILQGDFSVTFPASVKLSYKTYGNMQGVIFQTSQSKGSTTYSWKIAQLPSYPYEANAPNLRYIVPQVFLFIEEYTMNGQTHPVLSDERKLFNYYVSLIKNVDQEADSQLNAVVDSLTRGKSEDERIRSIYYWVQDHIRYIAFEDGLAGLVPRPARSVFQKRYGDCKDMATLLNCMLKRAGIPSHTAWIGTRSIPFKYHENPSLGVDNHMIAAIRRDGKWIFLDATADKIDYGLPTPHIQGKQAMVMLSEQEFTIADVPEVEEVRNSRRDTMELWIQETSVQGKGRCAYDGLWKMTMKYKLANLSEANKQTFYQSLFNRGTNKCKVGPVQETDFKARDQALRFGYDFEVPDYVRVIQGEKFVNLHLSRPLQNAQIEETRKMAIERDFRSVEEQVTILHLPAGTRLGYLPEGKSFTHDRFGFQITYSQEGSRVVARNRIYLKSLMIGKEDFSAWNEMVSRLNEAYNESISLLK